MLTEEMQCGICFSLQTTGSVTKYRKTKYHRMGRIVIYVISDFIIPIVVQSSGFFLKMVLFRV